MKTLGRGSLASIIKVVLDIVWYITWALLAFAALVLVAAAAVLVIAVCAARVRARGRG